MNVTQAFLCLDGFHPFAFRGGICYTGSINLRNVPRSVSHPTKEDRMMKVLKALLTVFTLLAVALTGVLLFVQDKNSPRYIQIYEGEQ